MAKDEDDDGHESLRSWNFTEVFLCCSGGEDKDKFWPVVLQCTGQLPQNKPRYCMGVGLAIDLVVCCAMGVDMFDCVFPTRTAVSTAMCDVFCVMVYYCL